MEKFKVAFRPDNVEIDADRGENLLSCAIKAGIYINSSCGGDGVCGRCKVIIEKGSFRTEPTGRITQEERKKGYVLACLSTIQGDLTVKVPPSSRLDIKKIKEEDAKLLRLKGVYSQAEDVEEVGEPMATEEVFSHSPLATKLYLELPPPTLDDNVSDLERLYREIRDKKNIQIMQTGLANIKRLGALSRQSDWKITVLLGKRNETTEIVSIEPGDRSLKNYGIAFDIGTTTVVGQLVNLNTKEVLGTKATHNRQIVFGDDVITRIIYATEEDGLEKLHHAVIDNMNEIIRELVTQNNVNLSDLNGVLCAGNTTMMHLLLRVDPRFIRMEPYVPTANFVPTIRAAEAGIKINPRGLLACIPGVSTYVGGDVVSGVVASGMCDEEELTVLIDVGTNGEIVVGNKEWLMSAAASAGPAFEGSGVSCGMRATSGAIQRVRLDDPEHVVLETIGSARPRGICGSGYIDTLAELFLHKILDRNGKISRSTKSSRIREMETGLEFVLAFAKETDIGADIVITESDIENLKRSKASIYGALATLLKKLNLSFEDVKRFYIAGGFGTYLDIEKAVTIGLLPDLERSKFTFIGNSSLIGAREALLSYEAFHKAEEIARRMAYLELSVEPGYMDEYIQA
ncbi:MAG: DUF4445 domain-containing protein, partial [Candidatus Omnitrophica bacterium]|nr:DUF4445 domain-containing protein [Candidatus Omnitrophota bacterium]